MDGNDFEPQQTTADYNTWQLDSPSKLVNESGPAGSGLTPSLFASLGSRGFTPSGFTPSAFGTTTADPPIWGYFDLEASSLRQAETAGGGFNTEGDTNDNNTAEAEDRVDPESSYGLDFGQTSGFRKRALSSPAIFLDGSLGSTFDNPSNVRFARQVDSHRALKRPRLSSMLSSSSGSGSNSGSGPSSYNPSSFTAATTASASFTADDQSPMSSAIRTPQDDDPAQLLPITDSFSLDKGFPAMAVAADFDVTAEQAYVDPSAAFIDTTILPPTDLSMVTAPPPVIAAPIPVTTPCAAPHATYQSFNFSALGNVPSVSHQPYMYEIEANAKAAAQLSATSASTRHNSTKGGPGKGRQKSAASMKESGTDGDDVDELGEEEEERDGDEDDDRNEQDKEAERKLFLERNRLAACKSRRKKKEKVTSLESAARDLGARNTSLQTVALSLRRELASLRQDLDHHDGCSCEHVKGYLAREMSGGGIPTIDALAGRVMSLDYSNVPTMGSDNDLYRDIFVPDEEAAKLLEAASKKSTVTTRRLSTTAKSTASLSGTSKQMAAAPSTKQDHTLRPIPTRRSKQTAQGPQAPPAQPSGLAQFEAAIQRHHSAIANVGLARGAPIPTRSKRHAPTNSVDLAFANLPALPMDMSAEDYSVDFQRASSAPPIPTPSWEERVGAGDSYF